MKKLKIVAFIALIAVLVLNIFSITAFAAGDPITNPNGWKPSSSNDSTLNEKIGSLLGVIQVIGVVVSVIVLMVLGIKYMVGSAEEKAINKKAMIPYLVGAVMVFSVTTIPNFIYQVTQSLFTPPCQHEYSSYNGRCTLCGALCEHKMIDISGVKQCQICGYRCIHKWVVSGDEHTCSECGFVVEWHDWDWNRTNDNYHICNLCNLTESHDWYKFNDTKHKCKICGMEVYHDEYYGIGTCSICNMQE